MPQAIEKFWTDLERRNAEPERASTSIRPIATLIMPTPDCVAAITTADAERLDIAPRTAQGMFPRGLRRQSMRRD